MLFLLFLIKCAVAIPTIQDPVAAVALDQGLTIPEVAAAAGKPIGNVAPTFKMNIQKGFNTIVEEPEFKDAQAYLVHATGSSDGVDRETPEQLTTVRILVAASSTQLTGEITGDDKLWGTWNDPSNIKHGNVNEATFLPAEIVPINQAIAAITACPGLLKQVWVRVSVDTADKLHGTVNPLIYQFEIGDYLATVDARTGELIAAKTTPWNEQAMARANAAAVAQQKQAQQMASFGMGGWPAIAP